MPIIRKSDKPNFESLIDFDPTMNEIMYHLTAAYRMIVATADNAPLDDVIKLHNAMEKYSRRVEALINIISQENKDYV